MTSNLRFNFSRRGFYPCRVFKLIPATVALLVVGLFFAEMPTAHAVLGIRAARNVIAARRAKQALAKKSDTPPPATETPAQKLQRLETESAGE